MRPSVHLASIAQRGQPSYERGSAARPARAFGTSRLPVELGGGADDDATLGEVDGEEVRGSVAQALAAPRALDELGIGSNRDSARGALRSTEP